MTQTNHYLGEPGQILVSEQLLEHRFETRHKIGHHNYQNHRGDGDYGTRINHGPLNFGSDFLGFLHELGQSLQYHFHHAGGFPGFYHVQAEWIEDATMLAERLGKGSAAFDALLGVKPHPHALIVYWAYAVNSCCPRHAKACTPNRTGCRFSSVSSL
jgi:hypothetical protein